MDALAGDALEQACFALLDAMADFFPKAQATLLRRAIQAGREQQRMAQEAAERILAEAAAPRGPSSEPPANTPESSDAPPGR